MLHQTLIQRRRLDIYDLVRVCDPRHDNGDSKPPVKTPRTNRCISHNKGSNELPLSRLDVSFLVKYDIYAVFYMINRQSLPFTLFQTRLKNTDSSKITWVSSHFDRVRRPLPSNQQYAEALKAQDMFQKEHTVFCHSVVLVSQSAVDKFTASWS